MDITELGSSTKASPVSPQILSGGSVNTETPTNESSSVAVAKDAPAAIFTASIPSSDDDSSSSKVVDAQVDGAVQKSAEANDSIKALAKGISGIVDQLGSTTKPNQQGALRTELGTLSDKLSTELKQQQPHTEPVDDKLKALAKTLYSFLGQDTVKLPAVTFADFIISTLDKVSETVAANQAVKAKNDDDDDEVKSANIAASKNTVEDVDALASSVAKLAKSDRAGAIAAISGRAPNLALLA